MFNVRVLQHVPFEGLGGMAAWFDARGAHVEYTRLFESPVLPDPRSADMVVAMGGPMSVNDEQRYPWLSEEKAFLRCCIESGTPVLGVCLGAQLIAASLGARVFAGRHREIGWFPVEGVANGGEVFGFPERATVFHWHGETFELPPDAVHLARSAACEHQAFQIGRHVIGLQFHLETTPESAALLIEHCGDELGGGEYVQSEAALRAAPESAYVGINALMDEVLVYLTGAL